MARDSDYKVDYNMPRENEKMKSWPRIYSVNILQPCPMLRYRIIKKLPLRTDKNFGGTLFCSVLSKNAA